jgi:predicted ATPase
LREIAERHSAHIETLADGSIVATIAGSGAATDTAMHAARFALSVRAAAPHARIGLVTGRANANEQLPLGEVLDAAFRLAAVSTGVRIGEVTAGLLDARFDVRKRSNGYELVLERTSHAQARTLLGRRTPCIGRERVIGTLQALFDGTVADGVASCVLVTGPAGIGKSRVREELLGRLADRDVALWIASADSLVKGTPFGMIAQPIRQDIGEGADRKRRLAARVARHVPEGDRPRVTAFLGELVGAPIEGDVAELGVARRDGIVMGDQIRRAWQDLLDAETLAHPVLIVLEDLHWGDLPSVKLIDIALHNLRNRPWMVLALARPDVMDTFPQLWADRGVQSIRLDELAPHACEKIVRSVLPSLAKEAVATIVERSAGNAFYLEELVRAQAENKGDALPDTVLAMVQSRLEGMHVELRRALRAASIFGNVFWGDAVRSLLGNVEPDA